MNTSILLQELEPLNAQIEQARQRQRLLEEELRVSEAELETFSTDRQRFDALRDVCTALDRLEASGAAELFWKDAPPIADVAGHRDRIRERLESFEEKIRGALENQQSLKDQIEGVLDELEGLKEEVRQAHAREERRLDEFVIEREISPIPYRLMVMPWSGESESERRFRRSMSLALLLSLLLGVIIPLVNVPIPDRSSIVVEIPERLAMLVKKEPPMPEPVPEKPREEKKPELEEEKADKPDTPKNPAEKQPAEVAKEKAKPAGAEAQAARKKAETVGVLAFKSSFADLMDETPVAKLGTEARVTNKNMSAPGQATAQRSLVAMQATGSSGGIANAGTSRNIGSGGSGNADKIGGIGFARVGSAVAGLAEEVGRPLSDGPAAGRTDEEIQIVFDRYKATLYRIYNKELRKDPTLRGKMLLRITIEATGEVSACSVESTDLASSELVAQIVDRVKKFNFGPKDDAPKTTILYPIDFLPAG